MKQSRAEPDEERATFLAAAFNYNTETWAAREYNLPWIEARLGADGERSEPTTSSCRPWTC